ncbi:MAG: S8 family peptidase [Prevotellaceae bacterium]|jgi:subtilisin family serine protease|nr:S8 family peptidase [Prevotellaceae bacterium]
MVLTSRLPILLAALLLFPVQLSAEAVMTLHTAKLIDRYGKSSQPLSARAQTTDNNNNNNNNNSGTVGVALSVSSTFDVKKLEALGVAVGTHINDVVTLRATPAQLAQVAQLEGVLFMSADSRARRKLDVALPLIKADTVQRGESGLPQAYTGKGVIVGVVDWGFDFTHPTFYDTLGNLRIASIWDQTDNSRTSSNPRYKYGSIYATPKEIEQKGCTTNDISHGTHVAGIAAGTGGSTGYRGVAPDAELVLVQVREGTTSDLIDGISYIFSYAGEVGKPAVVNLSMGSHDGPHDGTSAFDRALDGLVGQGRLAVGAVGNEGDGKLHASYTFFQNSSMRTVLNVVNGECSVKAYASVGQQLSWTIELWDAGDKNNSRLQQANGNNFYSSQTGATLNNKRFISTATETVSVSASSYSSDGYNRRGIVDIDVKNTNPKKYSVVLVLKANAGAVHLWNLGNEVSDGTFGVLKNSSYTWVNGDGNYTPGEVGGTAKGIITVGSYNSKGKFGIGQISSFSSKGPTTDGRVKPDVIAPGNNIVSAVNSCDITYSFPGTGSLAYEEKGGKRYYYAPMQGTSMSTPMVTGAVALLLQKRPTLTPDSVRCILQQNAIIDASIEGLSPNTRGAGKLNILDAVRNEITSICKPLSTPRLLWGSGNEQAIRFTVTPNPNSGTFRVETEEKGNLTIRVYSMAGSLLYSSPVQPGGEVQLRFLPHGLYVVQLTGEKKTGTKKMLVYR